MGCAKPTGEDNCERWAPPTHRRTCGSVSGGSGCVTPKPYPGADCASEDLGCTTCALRRNGGKGGIRFPSPVSCNLHTPRHPRPARTACSASPFLIRRRLTLSHIGGAWPASAGRKGVYHVPDAEPLRPTLTERRAFSIPGHQTIADAVLRLNQSPAVGCLQLPAQVRDVHPQVL